MTSNAVAVRAGRFGVAAALLAPLALLTNNLAALVSKFGISAEVAGAIITLMTSGGAAAVVALYPFVAPFIGTVEVALALWGVASTTAF